MKNILDSVFRSNPAYHLVLFDRLTTEHQQFLADLRRDPDLYGILQPREGSSLNIKSVSRDVALLFLTLGEAGKLPAYVQSVLSDQSNETVARLVLDAILEIQSGDKFVSGAEACGLVYDQPPGLQGAGALSRLSREALQYGQALEYSDPIQLSFRLYHYNRVPVSPRWRRLLPDADAVARYLGLHESRPLSDALAQHWSALSASSPRDGWFAWQARHGSLLNGKGQPAFKLYISPACEFIRDAWEAAVEVLTGAGCSHLKVGGDVWGLLRPDKMVAYFDERSAMDEAASRLADRLRSCPAHGVPFTAEWVSNGLLSWGMDPPAGETAVPGMGQESWRLWLTNRLAAALTAARTTAAPELEPWQFAMERLRLEGVDTQSWTPAEAIWNSDPTR